MGMDCSSIIIVKDNIAIGEEIKKFLKNIQEGNTEYKKVIEETVKIQSKIETVQSEDNYCILIETRNCTMEETVMYLSNKCNRVELGLIYYTDNSDILCVNKYHNGTCEYLDKVDIYDCDELEFKTITEKLNFNLNNVILDNIYSYIKF